MQSAVIKNIDDGTENVRQIKTNVAKLQQLQDLRNDRCHGLSSPMNWVWNQTFHWGWLLAIFNI